MQTEKKDLRSSLLLGGATLAVTAMMGGVFFGQGQAAFAQEETGVVAEEDDPVIVPEDDEEIERMVVTSFRQSIQDAIENKRNADTVIESITAEDIGRLPDISIAEALARLPGITTQRVTGQASALNVRGLSQSLTFATVNGRELVTANGVRAFEFEQIPSEVVSGADVYKSSKASLIEGGIAGTVDLKTVRPLSRDGRTITVNARGIYNDRADEVFDADDFGYRVSLSFIDQYFDNTLGVAFAYARLQNPDVSTRFVGFDYDADGFPPRDLNNDGAFDFVSFGFETEGQGGTDTRDAVVATIQWQPTDEFSIEVDGFYSRFEQDSFGRGIRVIGTQEVPENTTVDGPIFADNAIIGGTFARNTGAPTTGGGFGLTFQNINDNQFDDDELVSIGSKAEYENERVRASVDVTYSQSESFFANEVSAILPITSLDGGVPGVSNDLPATAVLFDQQEVFFQLNGTDIPTIDFTDDFTDRDLAHLARFGAFPFENTDRLIAYEGEIELFTEDDPFITSFEVGFRYADRDAEQFRTSADFGNDAGFFQFDGTGLVPIPLTEANSQVQCFSGEFADAGFPCYLVVEDPRALVESVIGPIVTDQSQGFTRSESFLIEEDVFAGYVEMNFASEVRGIPMTGNVGLRIVHTSQESSNQTAEEAAAAAAAGEPFDAAQAALASAGDLTFFRLLPAANFIFELSDRDQLRLGASRQISRPPLFQLGSGLGLSISNATVSGGGAGNPGLLPFLSTNGDISYERYFDNGGIVTAAFFYKALSTFIVNDSDPNFDFEEAGFLPALQQFFEFPTLDGNFIGTFGGPINGEGGRIWGLEFAYSQPFDFLPGPFDGLGVNLNYAFTQSEIDFTSSLSGESFVLPLPGLSDHVFNGTVYYELGGFSTRASVRYRSEFVSPQVGINQQLPLTDSEVVLDYQASYAFDETSPLAGLTLLFQANNLTDEPVATFFDVEAQTGTVQKFGRVFFFGASYTY